MKTEKEESLMNDRSHPRAEELADLPVTDQQAQQAKGGDSSTTTPPTPGGFDTQQLTQVRPQEDSFRVNLRLNR